MREEIKLTKRQGNQEGPWDNTVSQGSPPEKPRQSCMTQSPCHALKPFFQERESNRTDRHTKSLQRA